MKNLYFLILGLFLISCNEITQNDEKGEKEVPVQSSLTVLDYPDGTGSSGDVTTNLLGYGYDAKGFCDTISARAKVIDLTFFSKGEITHSRPFAAFGSLVSGGSFNDMCKKFWNFSANNDSLALARHIRSLLKLAYNTEIPESEHAYAYYSANIVESHYKLWYVSSELPASTTTEFKTDVVSLSTENLISKYGSHVLTDFFTGSKLEVLYSGDFDGYVDEYNLEQAFNYRLNQFLGSVPYILYDGEKPAITASEEKMIYNTIGSRLKICGMIVATDQNPDNIHIDATTTFGENTRIQFMEVNKDGLVPLYEFVTDPAKKQEIKNYISNYLVTGLPM